MFRATMCPSSGETTVFMRHLILVTLCWWLSGMQEHMLLHTRQSSTQSNKYQVSQKHSCFSWWWAHSHPKHVEIDKNKYTKNKYTKNKLCTKLVLFRRLQRDSRPTKQNLVTSLLLHVRICLYALCCVYKQLCQYMIQRDLVWLTRATYLLSGIESS